eukprot:Hpha_TRINITY_DN12287_c1_g1::TRINITY_DN12287_c1_g1_i1::g.16911::m.16911/K10839/RAD23, HR23; UV excision repair protein RAD23
MPVANIKTVAGEAFQVDVGDEATTAELREAIEKQQGYATQGMKLVCKGQVLAEGLLRDTPLFSSAAGNLIMVGKKRKAESAASPQQQPPPAPGVAAAAAATSAAEPAQPPAQPSAPAVSATTHPDSSGASPKAEAPKAEEPKASEPAVSPEVQMLLDFGMGWTKGQVTRALEMAGGSPDRASGLLMDGMVPPVPDEPPAAAPAAPAAATPPGQRVGAEASGGSENVALLQAVGGWDKEKVERALEAAGGDVAHAEVLLSTDSVPQKPSGGAVIPAKASAPMDTGDSDEE